jgi:hypothetical protein
MYEPLYTMQHKTLYTNCVKYIMFKTLSTMHKTLYTNRLMHKY